MIDILGYGVKMNLLEDVCKMDWFGILWFDNFTKDGCLTSFLPMVGGEEAFDERLRVEGGYVIGMLAGADEEDG